MTATPASTRDFGWRALMLVGVGGALGTAARYALSSVLPPVGGLPLTTVGINLAGAFALGWLLHALARSGGTVRAPATHRTTAPHHWRLFAGTGLLGGFTTYSALSLDTAALLQAGRHGAALAYALGTVIFGLACAALGVSVSVALSRGRGPKRGGESA